MGGGGWLNSHYLSSDANGKTKYNKLLFNFASHENCFEPFNGFDEDYDGPKGILTSHVPDGTSTLDYGNIDF